MIPEFPLPTVDADFYKSQIYKLPPIFGTSIQTPSLMEPSTFFQNNSIVSSLQTNCLENAVKRAAIRQRTLLKRPAKTTVIQLSPLSSVLGSFALAH